MVKKLLDTNIYIDLFSNPNLHEDILLSKGLVYLSSLVLMELIAGAHTKKAVARGFIPRLGLGVHSRQLPAIKAGATKKRRLM